jgi:hypothetical protein
MQHTSDQAVSSTTHECDGTNDHGDDMTVSRGSDGKRTVICSDVAKGDVENGEPGRLRRDIDDDGALDVVEDQVLIRDVAKEAGRALRASAQTVTLTEGLHNGSTKYNQVPQNNKR